MKINRLKNKKICILGYGIENQALVNFLLKEKIPCEITICDARKDMGIPKKIKYKLGRGYDENLHRFDIVSRIAGYPLFSKELEKIKKSDVEISSPTKLFFEFCPSKNIVGVTGTKGKGTTASLIYFLLKKSRKRVWFGGNIGTPMFSFFKKIKKNDWVILELSSFQLEDMDSSPHIAIFTNFYKEHLAPADPQNPNYHKNLSVYWQAKTNIFKWQSKSDILIINKKIASKINKKSKSQILLFSKSNLPSQLIGEHNKENIAAAVIFAKTIKIPEKKIELAIKNFPGLENRLELVKKIKGISFVNDSFSTTPESSIIALESFSSPIIILAGGADKGSNFKTLAIAIKQKAKIVILFTGKGSNKIEKELKNLKYKGKIKKAKSITEAMSIVKDEMKKGDVVLMSPGCASFGVFKNYKERGFLFKEEVKKIK